LNCDLNLMVEKKLTFKEHGWLRTNIKYSIIGIVVGLVMAIFANMFNPNGIRLSNILLNVLFSLFITLSIANIIGIVQCYFTPKAGHFWKFVIVFYLCNFLGMFIGIELSYLIVSLIFNTTYDFINHAGDYKVTTFITAVIGTLILLYHFQRVNSESALNEKEMELLKLSRLKTQIELQALQAKINPHFLYNALNSIVSLIHVDADKAEDMTIKLSKLFRYSINTMQENYCTISEEIEILNTYLAIEKVRFGDRINFQIKDNPALADKLIPRFLLQPLVENALKHGLKDVVGNGQITVDFVAAGENIELYIYDNGIPFPTALSAGYGLQSTVDKLQLLYKENHDLQLNNLPQKHIKITVPLT
jgi:two-component system LytT family sensor kinase